uniref:Uncharacterized protein n=1 Tax=Sinocyclocheilus anshuiensis TaxID=1608454 RepID=A0A671PRB1_9TELE
NQSIQINKHVLLFFRCTVTAYPDGQVEDSCQSMNPNHTDFKSQISSSLYKVSVNSTTFTPGQTITGEGRVLCSEWMLSE